MPLFISYGEMLSAYNVSLEEALVATDIIQNGKAHDDWMMHIIQQYCFKNGY